jgi:hypothetical protein
VKIGRKALYAPPVPHVPLPSLTAIQGPLSHLYSHILTSCFLDTILVPLCTWLYLLALIIPFPIFLFTRRPDCKIYIVPRESPKATEAGADTDPNTELSTAKPLPRRRSPCHMVLQVLYYLLILAQILMCILEITRLSLASLGIGLLPFTIVGILIAGLVHLFSTRFRDKSSRGWTKVLNTAYWTALVVVEVLKIVEETKEGVGTRKGTKYPMSDEVIDVGVMVGVYVALAVLELAT